MLTERDHGLRTPVVRVSYDEKTGRGREWREKRKEYEIQQITELEDLARKVGGRKHHFRFVQAPFNVRESNLLVEKRA